VGLHHENKLNGQKFGHLKNHDGSWKFNLEYSIETSLGDQTMVDWRVQYSIGKVFKEDTRSLVTYVFQLDIFEKSYDFLIVQNFKFQDSHFHEVLGKCH
jgi:hypothetical protein